MRGLRFGPLGVALTLCVCFSDGGGSDKNGGSAGSTSTDSSTGSTAPSTTSTSAPTGGTSEATGTSDGSTGGPIDTCDDPAFACLPNPWLCEGFEAWTVPPSPPWVAPFPGQPPPIARQGIAQCGDFSLEGQVQAGDLFSSAQAGFEVGQIQGRVTLEAQIFMDRSCLPDPGGLPTRLVKLVFTDPAPVMGSGQLLAFEVAAAEQAGQLFAWTDVFPAAFVLPAIPESRWFELRIDVDLDAVNPEIVVWFDGMQVGSTTGPQPLLPGLAAATASVIIGPFRFDELFGDSCFIRYDQVSLAPTP